MATRCCISATLSEEVETKFSQNYTVQIRDKSHSAITSSLADLNEKGRLMSLVPRDT